MPRLLSLRTPASALAAVSLLVLALVLAALLPGGAASLSADPRLDLPPLQAPGEWFDSQRGIETAAVGYADTLAESAAIANRTAAVAPDVADLSWDLLGPTNIGGRVVDLALVPGRQNEVYVATASGGVWHSADAGTTYAPRWDPELTQALGAMAAGPDGTLYVGTGESNPGGGSIVYGGTGLYRSTDDGATWELSGMPDSGAFGRIVVDPLDGDTVYAAASGNLFVDPSDPEADPGDRGLWRTTDAGESWERIFPQADTPLPNRASTGAVDVAVDPSNSDRILVAMWDHYRTPEKRVYAGPGSSVWLTEDGGTTWSKVTDIALDDSDANATDPVTGRDFTAADETGRIGVAFAPSDPNRVYAIIANTLDGTHGAWFSSGDGGGSFQRSNPTGLAANNSSYGWWFARIFVDPTDANHLFVAGLELIESTNGAQSFLPQSNTTALVLTGASQVIVHSDQHAMVWSPDVPGLVYVGNDGGVYRNSANGTAGNWVTGVSQGWTQHYSVDVDEQTAQYVVSGLQDNLCQMHVGGDGISAAEWNKYGLCGDGIVTRIDPADPQTTFYCSQYGGCGKATAGAPDLLGVTYRQPADRYGWLADIQFDPNNSKIIYTAGAQLHRTTNGGTNFRAISGDLSSQPLQEDPNSGYRLRGVVTTIATHPDGNTVWVGTDEGRLWVTHQAATLPQVGRGGQQENGGGWTLVDDGNATTTADNDGSLGLPERSWITSITVDPLDATGNTAYVAYSGFRQSDNAARLFKTTDGGMTFTDVSGDLPGAPINDVVLVAGDLLVASDVGVFLLDSEHGWLRMGDLPASPVMELRYHEGTQTLTAATFGHGIRRTTLG